MVLSFKYEGTSEAIECDRLKMTKTEAGYAYICLKNNRVIAKGGTRDYEIVSEPGSFSLH